MLKRKTSEELVKEYLANGGKITNCGVRNAPGKKEIRLKAKADRYSRQYQKKSEQE